MSAVPASSADDQVRGLILRPDHAKRFISAEDVGYPDSKKTLEIRKHKLWCVPVGGRIYIMASGHKKNEQGCPILPCHGILEFQGNETLEASTFSEHFQRHFCTEEELHALQSKSHSACKLQGWKVQLVEAFDPIKYLVRPVGEVMNKEWVKFLPSDLTDGAHSLSSPFALVSPTVHMESRDDLELELENLMETIYCNDPVDSVDSENEAHDACHMGNAWAA
ncbi:unnamed protein product [Symbiodinium sp. CCMP2592]|nr:unnamed protein product [Symbiodinium sp. CCMP2592]